MKKLICGFILAVIVFTLTGCGMFVERPEVKEGEFTGRQWALDNRKLYNHGRKEVAVKANLE
jgi:hypothetical protein